MDVKEERGGCTVYGTSITENYFPEWACLVLLDLGKR